MFRKLAEDVETAASQYAEAADHARTEADRLLAEAATAGVSHAAATKRANRIAELIA